MRQAKRRKSSRKRSVRKKSTTRRGSRYRAVKPGRGIWPGRLKRKWFDQIGPETRTHIFDRAKGENSVYVFEIVNYMAPHDLKTLAKAFVMWQQNDSKFVDVEIRGRLTSIELKNLRKLKVGEWGKYSKSLLATTTLEPAQRVAQYKEALEIVSRIEKDLDTAGLQIDDIIFVETESGDGSEQYHRDGNRDDTNPRMIIYGSDIGPGTYFANGDCNQESQDDLTTRPPGAPGFAPRGWRPEREELVKPEIGKAIIFTGNMCHKRETHSESRWGFLLNLEFSS